MRQYRVRPERVLHDHADALRPAQADGTPTAIAAAIVRIRDEDAVALHQLQAQLRP